MRQYRGYFLSLVLLFLAWGKSDILFPPHTTLLSSERRGTNVEPSVAPDTSSTCFRDLHLGQFKSVNSAIPAFCSARQGPNSPVILSPTVHDACSIYRHVLVADPLHSVLLVFSGIFTFLVDAYPLYAASSLAANSFARSSFGGKFSLCHNQFLSEKLTCNQLPSRCLVFRCTTSWAINGPPHSSHF